MPNSKHGHYNEQRELCISVLLPMSPSFQQYWNPTEVSMMNVESQDWIKYWNFITTTSLHWVILQSPYELVVIIHLCSDKVSCFFLGNFALSSTITGYHLHDLKSHDFSCLILSNWSCTFFLPFSSCYKALGTQLLAKSSWKKVVLSFWETGMSSGYSIEWPCNENLCLTRLLQLRILLLFAFFILSPLKSENLKSHCYSMWLFEKQEFWRLKLFFFLIREPLSINLFNQKSFSVKSCKTQRWSTWSQTLK